ncbi:Ig-like domain-containing protein, partial [Pseudomonas denitrificans (nom. rej.)]|nr:Ig-like domain-containing protein [Pseudomonas denitrificans (nom. rej.)]
MAIEKISLVVVTDGGAKRVAIKEGGKFKVEPGTKYLLKVDNTDVAPQNVTVKRNGKNLEVLFEGSDEADLVLTDFFAEGMDGQLYGVAEDGQLHAFVCTNGASYPGPWALADGEMAPIALDGPSLGTAPVIDGEIEKTAGFILWPLLAATGVAGAVGATRRDDNNHKGTTPPVTNAKATDYVGPTQGTIANGAVIDDARPVISGNGLPGATVHIYDNGTVIGSTVVSPDGTWSFQPPTDLRDSTHSISADQYSPGNNPSEPVPIVDFTVDTVPPEVPKVWLDPASDSGAFGDNITNVTQPTINGTAEANALVTVTIQPTGEIIHVTADDQGNWSVVPTQALPEGVADISAIATDVAGNSSQPDNLSMVIDTTPPDLSKLAITGVHDNVGDIVGLILEGGETDDVQPLIKGIGTPGDSLIAYTNTASGLHELGRTVVGADGTWSIKPLILLEIGLHELTAVAIDVAGNEATSKPFHIIINLSTPETPKILSVLDDVGPATGLLHKGDTTDDKQPTFSGTAQAGAIIKLYDSNGALIGSGKTDAKGEWSIATVKLADGLHEVTAVAVNVVGRVSEPSDKWPLIVDTSVPKPLDPTQWEIIDDVGAVQGPIRNGNVIDDGHPTVRGVQDEKLTPGYIVKVYDEGKLIGSTTVKADGTWSVDVPAPQGPHSVTITVTNLAKTEGDKSAPIDFSTDLDPNAPSITGVYNDEDPSLVLIERTGYTNDVTPEVYGQAKAGSLVEVYDNTDTLVGSTIADSKGEWVLDVSTLGEGAHTLSVRAREPSGNWSEKVSPYTFNIDITAPVKPTIDYADDTVGTITGKLSDKDFTDDPNPVFRGTGEAGSVIHLFEVHDGGKRSEIGSTVVAPNGQWSIKPTEAYSLIGIPATAYTFTADSYDKAGNHSTSNDFHLTVDFVPPAAPTIEHVVDNVGTVIGEIRSDVPTDERKPLVSGTSDEGGLTVVVYNIMNGGKVEIGRTTSGKDGAWTLNSDQYKFPLSGDVKLIAEAFDPAGNTSVPSNERSFTVLTEAPAQPTIQEVWNDDVEPGLNVQPGTYTNDNTALIKGTSEAGTKIKVFNGDKLLGTADADSNGQWHFNLPTGSPDGKYDIHAIAVNRAGMESTKAGPYSFFVDTSVPKPLDPTQWEIIDDVGAVQGPIRNGNVIDDGHPTVRGVQDEKLTPGYIVKVYDEGKLIGSTTVKADGTWSVDVPAPQGPHSVTITVTNLAKTEGDKSAPIDFSTDLDPNAPSITGVYNDEDPSLVLIERTGYTNDVTPEVYGQAKAGSLVEVYDNTDTLVGSTIADSKGEWVLDVSTLGEGAHTLSVRAREPSGNWSEKVSPYTFNIDITAPVKPTIDYADDTVGTITGKLSDKDFTDDPNPVFRGTGEAGSVIHLFEVHDGGKRSEIGSTVVAPNGQWSIKPTEAYSLIGVPVTTYTFTADSYDKAGNHSTSNDFHLSVDFVPPEKPVIESVYADEGYDTGIIKSGSETEDPTPIVSGRAEAGSTVVLKDNGTAIGTAIADKNGKWSITLTTEMAVGDHKLTAEAIDATGNTSKPSDRYDFAVIINGDDTPAELSNKSPVLSYMVLLDISGSMAGAGIAAAKAALLNMIATTVSMGAKTTLNLITFSSFADDEGVFTFSSAADSDYARLVSLINGLSVGGSTNYGRPMSLAMQNIQAEMQSALVPNKQVFFISDGYPDSGSTVPYAEWQALMATPPGGNNPIPVTTIGLGSGITDTFLSQITTSQTIMTPNQAQLSAVIQENLFVDSASGNLLANDAKLTLDGKEHITQVVHDGATYRIVNDTLEVDNPNATTKASYDAAAGRLVLDTAMGMLTLYMKANANYEAGAYIYQLRYSTDQSGVDEALAEFRYTGMDSGGHTQTSTLGIHVSFDESDSGAISILSMSKDSGVATDFITSDDEAGQLVQGSVAQKLAAGNFLEASTDGATVVAYGVDGHEMYRESILRTTTGTHYKAFSNTAPAAEDVGSFKVVSATSTLPLSGFSETQVLRMADSRGLLVDQLADSFYGATTADVVNLTYNAASYVSSTDNKGIHGGDGVDTLKIVGYNQNLDLITDGSKDKLTGIEIIDLTSSNTLYGNSLKLSLQDVLENGQTDLFHSTSKHSAQMMVKGDAMSVVSLDDLLGAKGPDVGDWAASGTVSVGGGNYAAYQHSGLDAEVLVQENVRV